MSPNVVTAIVGAAGSFVGLLIGAMVTLTVERRRRNAERDAELTRALVNYLQATELVAIEISELPASSWIERQVDRVPQRRLGYLGRRLLQRLVLGGAWERVTTRYQASRAEVLLLAPIEVIGQVLVMDDLFANWEGARTPDFLPKWSRERDKLRLMAQSTVDKYRGRSYRAGEQPGVKAECE